MPIRTVAPATEPGVCRALGWKQLPQSRFVLLALIVHPKQPADQVVIWPQFLPRVPELFVRNLEFLGTSKSSISTLWNRVKSFFLTNKTHLARSHQHALCVVLE
eukprot:c13436_g1_i1.p1 GENE.c13436_g1_i1~~c13436_g1_i1.p1  ORF type:complete len:104 (-),score=7.25 c13436_g1_i1:12-323(-)